ncbi:MAG TPA: polyphosphate kinase 2 family protein [Ignavibacteriaceae bacterium]|nr:polyphosphate kinase 2 family protein [Ignavibacteriaceae bacterium]
MNKKDFQVKQDTEFSLDEFSTSDTGGFKDKGDTKDILKKNIKKMFSLQNMLYAYDKYSLLIIFQAMDAAGKDGTIKHVMSGLNPQGTQVFSFKQPSPEELDHDYLWRIHKHVPERGRIGIFNRSHYEEVLVVRVHDLIKNQKIPPGLVNKDIWDLRYREINNFEQYLYENGTIILKFFLHVSKEEQKQRFLKRIDTPEKNWKFSASDIDERKYWDKYQAAYAEAISATSKKHSPWFIIPADRKWFMRYAVSQVIVEALEGIKMSYPVLSDEQLANLESCKEQLLQEK